MTLMWPSVQNGSLLVLVAALSANGCTPAQGNSPVSVTRYRCAENRYFIVERSENAAVVSYANTRYSLGRKPSSVGLRYASSEATLIIDSDFAAFVSETVTDLDDCRDFKD